MRTSAIQCFDEQSNIEQVIPIYWDDPSIANPMDRMSLLMVSNNALEDANKSALYSMNCTNYDVQCATGRPSVAILLDMGLRHSEVEARYDSGLHRCWRVYASGITSETFPFLEPHPQVATTLGHVVRRAAGKPVARALLTTMTFGASPLLEDIRWETGGKIIEKS